MQGDHGHMQDAMDALQWDGNLEDTEFNEQLGVPIAFVFQYV